MVVGLLAGVETDVNVRHEDYKFKFLSTQETSTYNPIYSPQYTMAYNPQVVLGSPYASIGGGTKQAPYLKPVSQVIPRVDQTADLNRQEAPMGGGNNNWQDLAIVAIVAGAAIFILPKLFGGKKHGRKSKRKRAAKTATRMALTKRR